MHQCHTAAFKQLFLQVLGIATELKNYTDTQVDKVNGIDSLQRTHEFDHQQVLTAIAHEMNLVNRVSPEALASVRARFSARSSA